MPWFGLTSRPVSLVPGAYSFHFEEDAISAGLCLGLGRGQNDTLRVEQRTRVSSHLSASEYGRDVWRVRVQAYRSGRRIIVMLAA